MKKRKKYHRRASPIKSVMNRPWTEVDISKLTKIQRLQQAYDDDDANLSLKAAQDNYTAMCRANEALKKTISEKDTRLIEYKNEVQFLRQALQHSLPQGRGPQQVGF